MIRRRTADSGMALVGALMALTLVMAIGAALILLTTSETITAANFTRATEAGYAADAGAERAIADLSGVRDWSLVLGGAVRSGFVDGDPSGPRTLEDGNTIDLTAITNIANCEKATPCAEADMDAVTMDRPWGANNPRWRPYAYGPLGAIQPPGPPGPAFYLVVLVGDDGGENDANPSVDGGAPSTGEPTNPGDGTLLLRAEAFGPSGAHGRVDLTVCRSVRVVSWREVP